MSDRAKFFVATSKGPGKDQTPVTGVLMIYRGMRRNSSWLVADSPEIAIELSEHIQFQKGSIWTKPEFESVLQQAQGSRSVPWKIESKMPFAIMKLDPEHTNLAINHEWRTLSESDAYEFAKSTVMMEIEEREDEKSAEEQARNTAAFEKLMQTEPSTEEINASRDFIKRFPSFGIIQNGTLAARAAIEVLGNMVAIRRVFTNPNNRRKGFGMSITSVAVREALKHENSDIILFVRENNYGAKKIYEKIGFRKVAARTEFDLAPV